jgi:hypothetical protein
LSALQLTAIIMIAGFSFISGAIVLLAYILKRMMGNTGWDDSNITNALRLLSHVTLHPEDFGKMYYLTSEQLTLILQSGTAYDNPPIKPFWYVGDDELSEVVGTRPE